MDAQQQENPTTTQEVLLKPKVIPGPKRLAFRIRNRGFSYTGSPTLLISNRLGVWSLGHRRYIRKTRYHRFCTFAQQLRPVEAAYHSLLRRGMRRWPEYERARGEITFWKHRLMDMFWSVAPDAYKANTIRAYRDEARRRRSARFAKLGFLAAALVLWWHLVATIVTSELLSAYPAWVSQSFALWNVCLAAVVVDWLLAADRKVEFVFIAHSSNDVR